MNSLFYELIRVAIGMQEGLSRLPSQKEWKALYDMAKKQSLVGVCFAALQRLGADADEDFARIGMSEMLYLTWMGMTAKIQQKNQTVDEQCVALQKRLSADGLRSCVLKGQGVAGLYSEQFLGLRQSGDIDIYVDCGMEKALAYAREKFGDVRYDYINAHVPVFDTSAGSETATEVDLHWRAQALTNIFANRRLQKWLEKQDLFRYRDAIICVAPGGDNGWVTCNNIKYFKESGCEIAVSASRSKGAPVDDLDMFAKEYGLEVRWFNMPYIDYLPSHIRTIVEHAVADEMLTSIDRAMTISI